MVPIFPLLWYLTHFEAYRTYIVTIPFIFSLAICYSMPYWSEKWFNYSLTLISAHHELNFTFKSLPINQYPPFCLIYAIVRALTIFLNRHVPSVIPFLSSNFILPINWLHLSKYLSFGKLIGLWIIWIMVDDTYIDKTAWGLIDK